MGGVDEYEGYSLEAFGNGVLLDLNIFATKPRCFMNKFAFGQNFAEGETKRTV